LLGSQLYRLRMTRGITRETAGAAIRASQAKISRLEQGRVRFQERDVVDLLILYGITDHQERDAVLTLARRADLSGWWHRYSDIVPEWFELYVGLEQASSVIRSYEPHLVPDLLQTEECARALIPLGHPTESTEEIDRRVGLRMKRQEVLTRSGAPNLWAVVDEAALWRLKPRSLRRAQIRHLMEMAELPNITLQVVSMYSSDHVAVSVPFTILRFSEPDLPDIVYLEQVTSALYLDKSQDVHHYMMAMDLLVLEAKSPSRTVKFLAILLEEG
ncbi:MAG: helix-turn-helix domain-containing protein, partial [Pseudonocardiaceae bacterium]